MRGVLHTILLLLFCTKVVLSTAQNNPTLTDIVSEILEEQQNFADLPINGEELYNDLVTLAQSPIDLNSAKKEDLERLPFLTDFQVENILYYTYTSGAILSLYELKAVPGLSDKTIKWLLPFIRIGSSEQITSTRKTYIRNQFLVRYNYMPELPKGYGADSGNVYLGNRNALQMRLDGEISNKMTYHLLTEKDRGEQRITDFIGGSAQYKGSGTISRIIVGDYKIRSGQGLLSWSGSILGKSMEPDLVRKKGEVLSMYKSSMEFGFFRGGAVQLKPGKVQATFWGSKLAADATIDSIESGKVIRSIRTTGHHNTQTSLDKKNNIALVSAGGNVQFNNKWFRPGFTYLYNRLNLPFQPGNDLSYQHLQASNEWHQYSMDFFSSLKNMHFWGEIAYQSDHHFAGIGGLTLYPADALQATLIYRSYSPGFYSFYGNALGESGTPRNEKGLFLGMKIIPFAKFTIATSVDIYTFPWLKYQQQFVSDGIEAFLRLSYAQNSASHYYLQLRYEKREKTKTLENNPLSSILMEEKAGIRLNYQYTLGGGWEMNSRIESSFYNLQQFSKGILLLQDVMYKPPNSPWSGNVRFAWFQTDDYDARIYAYENDVLYAFSVPSYSGKGIRTYLNVKYSPLKWMDCWLRLARLLYFDREIVGSGLDEIAANHRSEIKLQVRAKF